MMDPAAQAAYVSSTEKDAYILNTSGTVEWEWFANWANASKTYYPRLEQNDLSALFRILCL